MIVGRGRERSVFFIDRDIRVVALLSTQDQIIHYITLVNLSN